MLVQALSAVLLSSFLALPPTLASSGAFYRTYSGHQRFQSGIVRHYFLTDRIENQQRIFSLFARDKNEFQDLAEEQRFSMARSKDADLWLQQTLKKYGLQLETPLVLASNDDSPELFDDEDAILSPAVLWHADKEWSEKWEQEYAKWVGKELYPGLMVSMKLPTDCAELAYVERGAFARKHRLPMAIRDGGSSQLFPNESMKEEWLDLPEHQDWKKDRRFRAVLEYIMRNTYTHTLMEDSYPVAINARTLGAGIHFLDLHGSSGHTMVVKSVNDPEDLPITLLFSTVPIRIRELISTFYQDQEAPKLNRSGLYKIRWAKKVNGSWKLVAAKNHPGYSLEQFQLADIDFPSPTPHFLKVYQRLNPEFSRELLLEKSMQELRDRMQDRIKMVEDGFAFCQRKNCAPGSRGDDDWSTPSRDRRLIQLHETVQLALELIRHKNPSALPSSQSKWKQFAKSQTLFIQQKNISLENLVNAFEHQLTQTDPRVSIARRWGVELEGYSENLIASLLTYLPKRQQFEQSHGSCNETLCGGKLAASEQLLQKQLTGTQKLCRAESPSTCQELDRRLDEERWSGRSLKQWIKLLGHSSDPEELSNDDSTSIYLRDSQ
jgi:hypothetical protein